MHMDLSMKLGIGHILYWKRWEQSWGKWNFFFMYYITNEEMLRIVVAKSVVSVPRLCVPFLLSSGCHWRLYIFIPSTYCWVYHCHCYLCFSAKQSTKEISEPRILASLKKYLKSYSLEQPIPLFSYPSAWDFCQGFVTLTEDTSALPFCPTLACLVGFAH